MFRLYFKLTKPGILFGNAVTSTGGFLLASRQHFDARLFLYMLLGLLLVVASACVFNNHIDKEKDRLMQRTKNRPLAKGEISSAKALCFGVALGVLGSVLLFGLVGRVAAASALLGWAVYVLWYSPAKYRTVHGTLIGSIAGAMPPVVGYTALSHQLDLAALLLFAMVTLWQMPHFYAIALYRLEDYAAAGTPVLPLIRGIRSTKIQMLLYICGFFAASLLLPLLGFTGLGFLIIATLVGLSWLLLNIRGFGKVNDRSWGRSMFLFSLIAVTAQCAAMRF